MTTGAEIVSGERRQPLTVAELQARVTMIRDVRRKLMKDKVHFGVIPGTPKPSLWKPGAELLLGMFHMAPEPIVEDLSGPDEIRYRVTCRVTEQGTNVFLGSGIGECSTDEFKYRWRAAVSTDEWAATQEDRRTEKWKKNEKDPLLLVRTNPADLANTVLKMAKKRALVDAALTVTFSSEEFSQDLEDLDEDGRGGTANATAAAAGGVVDDGGIKVTKFTQLKKATDMVGDGDQAKPKWVLYEVVFSDGKKATTIAFPDNDKIARAAGQAKANRWSVTYELEPSKAKSAKEGDMQIKGLSIVKPPAAPAATTAAAGATGAPAGAQGATEQPAAGNAATTGSAATQPAEREPGGDDGELFGASDGPGAGKKTAAA